MSIKPALFIFALTALTTKADVSASFANVGPVDSGTFRTAANPAGNDTINLACTIDGTEAVSLDTSTTNTTATFVNRVNQFDRPGVTAGSTTNSGFFNTSFSLKIVPVRAGSNPPALHKHRPLEKTFAPIRPGRHREVLNRSFGMVHSIKNHSTMSSICGL